MQVQLDHGHHDACLPTLPLLNLLLELRPDCRVQQLQLQVVPRTWHLSLRTAAALSARKYQQSQHHPHQRHCRCPRQRHQVLRRPRHGGSRRKGMETRHIRASGDTWNEKTDVKAPSTDCVKPAVQSHICRSRNDKCNSTTTYYHSQQKPPWAPSGIKLRNAPDI